MKEGNMDQLFDRNINMLRKRNSTLAAVIERSAADGSIQVVRTGENLPVPVLQGEGRQMFIHSRFDPVTEARRFIGELAVHEHDLFIVFGFGFGYHVEELAGRVSREAVILSIEKNPSLLRLAMENRDLSSLISDERIIMLADPDEEALSSALKGKASSRVSFITHRGSHQIYGDYYAAMLETCRSYLSTKEVNIATLAKFEKIWTSNIARNIGSYVGATPASSFYGAFAGLPAILAAAGPSLEKSLEFIRDNRDRAVVIAVDTSLRILVRAGIEPHFCVAVDPQVINARYFEGLPELSTILVADPTVHPSIFHLYRGPVAATGIAFDMMKWIESICGEKGEMTHGGSVSTSAYDLARRFGCSPVIMSGQDLSFTGGRAHARGSYLEEQVFLRVNRLWNAEMHNRFQVTALPRIKARGIRSDPVITNQKMMIFLAWFQKQKNPSLINATWDGVLMQGVEHREQSSISLGDPALDISALALGLYEKNSPSLNFGAVTEAMRSAVRGMLGELESMMPALSRAEVLSDKLMGLLSAGNRDQRKIDSILQRLADTDRIMASRKSIRDLVSLVSQRAIHTINEGYEIDSGDGNLPPDVLVAKRSHFLYRELLDGCRFNRKALNNMLKTMEESGQTSR